MRFFRRNQGVHFEGDPSRFSQMRALFPTTDTRRIVASRPIDKKFRITRIATAIDQWRKRHAA